MVSIQDSLDGRQFYLSRNVSYLGVFLVSRILFGGDLNRGPGGKPVRVLHRTLPVSRVPNVGKLTSIKAAGADLTYFVLVYSWCSRPDAKWHRDDGGFACNSA